MKNDIEWLKEQILILKDKYITKRDNSGPHSGNRRYYNGMLSSISLILDFINELDKPEVLSQEFINKHEIHTHDSNRSVIKAVPVDRLQTLLVPKQEITEEQVINWLDSNEFYDHITAETVLGRAVDKGELSYYGTKYSVIEAPIIPKYVADYLEFAKKDASLIQVMEMASVIGCLPTMKKVFGWILANDETFARAWLNGYKVEEEPLYYALFKGHELTLDSYKNLGLYRGTRSPMYISYKHPLNDEFVIKMSKSQWNELGINDSNANFVKVEEVEK